MSHNDPAATQPHPHPEAEHSAHLDLDIRATNNADWEAKQFKDDDLVGEVAKKAVEHFVDKKVMSPGDYALALEVDGNVRPPLNDAASLKDAGVADHSVLRLVPRDPQKDGC